MPGLENEPHAPLDLGPHGTSEVGAQLNRGLGVGAIVYMVIAAAAPLGIVAGTLPIVFVVSGSSVMPLFFLVTTGLLLLFSVGFTLMSRRVSNAGAFYSYIQVGLGRKPGLGAATLAVSSYVLIILGVSVLLGVSFSSLLEGYTGTSSPWWIWSVLALIIVGVLGYRDIELSSKVLGGLLIAEVVSIVVMNLFILGKGGEGGLNADPVNLLDFGQGSPALGVMFAFFAFFGFEATAVFRYEAKEPQRTIPRATYIAVILIGLFHFFTAWIVVLGVGSDKVVAAANADPAGMVLTLAAKFGGTVLYDVMLVLLVTSLFAAVLSFHNVVSRYQFTLSQAGVLPKRLGQVHPRHGAPSNSSALLTGASLVLVAVLALTAFDPIAQLYAWTSGAATLGLVALMSLTSLSVVTFFARTKSDRRLWHTTVAPTLAFLGLAGVLAMVVANFDLLIGDRTAALLIGSYIFLSFVGGCGAAAWLQAYRPEKYEMLNSTTVLDEAPA